MPFLRSIARTKCEFSFYWLTKFTKIYKYIIVYKIYVTDDVVKSRPKLAFVIFNERNGFHAQV